MHITAKDPYTRHIGCAGTVLVHFLCFLTRSLPRTECSGVEFCFMTRESGIWLRSFSRTASSHTILLLELGYIVSWHNLFHVSALNFGNVRVPLLLLTQFYIHFFIMEGPIENRHNSNVPLWRYVQRAAKSNHCGDFSGVVLWNKLYHGMGRFVSFYMF